MFQGSFKSVSRKFWGNIKGVSRKFPVVLRVFEWSVKGVSQEFHGSIKKVSRGYRESFNGIFSKFQGYFWTGIPL